MLLQAETAVKRTISGFAPQPDIPLAPKTDSETMAPVKLSAAALIASVVLTTTPASADATADALNTRGVELRRKGDHEVALRAFQDAYRASPSPKFVGQMGLVEHDLRRWLDSEAHLAEALATSDPWVIRHRRTLEQVLDVVRSHIGLLAVTGTPGAVVHVNGSQAGTLPLAAPIRLGEGTASVLVTAPGHEPLVRDLEVRGRGVAKLEARLEATGPAPPPSTSTGPPEGAVSRREHLIVTPPHDRDSIGWRRPTLWVTGAATAASTAVALAYGGVAIVRYRRFNTFKDAPLTESGKCSRSVVQNGGGRCTALLDPADRARNVALVAGGGALFFGSLSAWLLLSKEPSSMGARADLACVPAIGSYGGATCALRF